MKLVRYGEKGAEKPGLIDKSGQLRDLSAHLKDLTGDAYAPESLKKLAALDPASLPAVSGKPARVELGLAESALIWHPDLQIFNKKLSGQAFVQDSHTRMYAAECTGAECAHKVEVVRKNWGLLEMEWGEETLDQAEPPKGYFHPLLHAQAASAQAAIGP